MSDAAAVEAKRLADTFVLSDDEREVPELAQVYATLAVAEEIRALREAIADLGLGEIPDRVERVVGAELFARRGR